MFTHWPCRASLRNTLDVHTQSTPQPSRCVHSRYTSILADQPWARIAVLV